MTCPHGKEISLCYICALEDEIKHLKAQVLKLETDVKHLSSDNDRLNAEAGSAGEAVARDCFQIVEYSNTKKEALDRIEKLFNPNSFKAMEYDDFIHNHNPLKFDFKP